MKKIMVGLTIIVDTAEMLAAYTLELPVMVGFFDSYESPGGHPLPGGTTFFWCCCCCVVVRSLSLLSCCWLGVLLPGSLHVPVCSARHCLE